MGYKYPFNSKSWHKSKAEIAYLKKFRAIGEADSAIKIQRAARNKAVGKALAAKGQPKITAPKANTNAIVALSKQVRDLQLNRFGNLQRQVQSCTLTSQNNDDMPYTHSPLFFCFNDFYDVQPVYKASVSAGLQTVPVFTQVKSMRKQNYNTNLEDKYEFNQRNNQDTVSQLEYLPVSCNLRMQFHGDFEGNYQFPVRYRITIFKLKNAPNQSSAIDVALPATMGALWKMCEDDPNKRNHFSKQYHQVLVDRWLTIKPPTVQDSTAAQNVVRRVYRNLNINYTFPRGKADKPKSLKPNKEPPIPPATDQETLWSNIAQEDLIWCLISCNSTGDTQNPAVYPQFNIDMQRKLVWRDRHDVGPHGH